MSDSWPGEPFLYSGQTNFTLTACIFEHTPSAQEPCPVELSALKLLIVTIVPVLFSITRKQSVLHNIPMAFKVSSNTKADGGEPIYELMSMSAVSKHIRIIEAEAKKTKS